MNKVVLVGRLTKDPEIRSTSSGITTANFTVAANRNFKNKDGNYEADFLPCVAFRNTAEFISKYFKKGNMICLDGRVQTRNYDAEDGTKRYVTEIVVENVEFGGGNNKNEENESETSLDDIGVPDNYNSTYDDKEIKIKDSDLPF